MRLLGAALGLLAAVVIAILVVRRLAEACRGSRRISVWELAGNEALDCFRSDDLVGIGMEADAVRRKLHPECVVSYVLLAKADIDCRTVPWVAKDGSGGESRLDRMCEEIGTSVAMGATVDLHPDWKRRGHRSEGRSGWTPVAGAVDHAAGGAQAVPGDFGLRG